VVRRSVSVVIGILSQEGEHWCVSRIKTRVYASS
jgi:hypothetical protein